MNKKELIRAISRELDPPMSQDKITLILDKAVEITKRTLADGEPVKWAGFGSFVMKDVPPRLVLLSCKEGFHIRVNNLRYVVILFDELLENSFIQSRWQSVLDKGRFLQSKNGTRFITASNLSSALSAVRKNMTSVAYGIKRVIKELKL